MIIRPTLVVTTLILFVLKVTGAVDWHWAWILAPVWVPVLVFVLLVALFCLTPPPDEDGLSEI